MSEFSQGALVKWPCESNFILKKHRITQIIWLHCVGSSCNVKHWCFSKDSYFTSDGKQPETVVLRLISALTVDSVGVHDCVFICLSDIFILPAAKHLPIKAMLSSRIIPEYHLLLSSLSVLISKQTYELGVNIFMTLCWYVQTC